MKEFKKKYKVKSEHGVTAGELNKVTSNYFTHIWTLDNEGNMRAGFYPSVAVKFYITEEAHELEEVIKVAS